MAGDQDDRKSTSGMIYFLSCNPITWQDDQKILALSTCEAEYIAASVAAYQVMWLAHLMGELIGEEASTPVMLVVNKAVISLIRNLCYMTGASTFKQGTTTSGSVLTNV
jgi:hypothetical protein